MIPPGYCQCGCGQRAPVSTRSRPDRGQRRGEPVRFILGHAPRLRKRQPVLGFDAYDVRDCGYLTPCWVWRGAPGSHGYGHIRVAQRIVLVHRAFYVKHVGPIPDALTIDHLCRNRMCVNPTHLEPVTSGENTRRGISARKAAA